MNFDINQDLSSLQSVRNPRNRRIRPDKGKGKPGGGPSQPKLKKPLSAQQQPSEQAQAAGQTTHAPIAALQNLAAEVPIPAANVPAATQTSQQEQAFPLPASLELRQPSDAIARGIPVCAEQKHAGVGGDAPAIPGSGEAVGSQRLIVSAGQSTLEDAPDVLPILEPAAPVTDGGSPAGPPAGPAPPLENPIPQKKPRKAPVRKRTLPEVGTSISKKPAKPRKKTPAKNPRTPVPSSTSVDHECSTVMVTCDTDAEHVDQPLAVAKAKVNQYDEMTRALCPGKRHKGKRKKIDPAAPIDPKNMTLMDVIRHAHSNANILDRQYKERKANEQKEKAQAALSASDALPAPPAEPEAGPSTEEAPTAPQLVLRDGKIVVDEASLRVQATDPVGFRRVEVEEDDDTLINSHSYLPVSKLTKERWTRQETDLFYHILTSFGADFTFMSQCFQGRTRKQVKNKYLKEQKVNPARVREAMSGRQTASLAQLSSLAQPGTAAASIAAMLPDGGAAVGETSGMVDERAYNEDEECIGVPVNPRAGEFFY